MIDVQSPALLDDENFASLLLAGAPDDDGQDLLPCDVEPRRQPLKPWVPERIRLAVMDRDGWTCQLCHQPIDRALRWPAPLSASLDHIVPRADGGPHQL